MRINNNIQALNAYRQLSTNNEGVSKSIEKLSSGLRINRAGDDAAGLAISEKMRGQIRGLNQGTRNAQDAISMIQTAEGALNETHNILQRMRELSVQASNGTLASEDRTSIGEEMNQLAIEVDRIANTTQFNGQTLLAGSLKTDLDVTGASGGANTAASAIQMGKTITPTNGTFAISSIDVSGAASGTSFSLTGTGSTLTLTNTTTNVAQSVTVTDMAASSNGTQEFNFSSMGVKFAITGSVDAAGAATATDIADALRGLSTAATHIKTDSGNASAEFAIGANKGQTMSVSFGDMNTDKLGGAAGTKDLYTLVTNNAANQIVSTSTKAQDLTEQIDKAIVQVSDQRGKFGAAQNRLEYTIRNLQTAAENLTASESRVRDVDMAKEIMTQTKNNILSQAAQAMLAQANQSPQGVLQLLR